MTTAQGDFLFNCVIVLMLTVIVVGGLIFSNYQEQKFRKYLSEVARRLGWDPWVEYKFPETIIRGQLQGREMQIRQYKKQSKYEKILFGEISVLTKAAGFDFTITRLGISERFFEKLGDVYEKTGDTAFDDIWHLTTGHAEGLRALLSPDVRAKFVDLAHRNYTGQFQLTAGRLSYREDRSLANPAFLARLEGVVGFLLEVAAAVETVVEILPPPRIKRDGYGDPVNFDDDKKTDDWGEASPDYDRRP